MLAEEPEETRGGSVKGDDRRRREFLEARRQGCVGNDLDCLKAQISRSDRGIGRDDRTLGTGVVTEESEGSD